MRTPTSDVVLVGRGDRILLQSFDILRQHVDTQLQSRSPRLSFMTEEHHRVRDFCVAELPRLGRALSAEQIADGTGVSRDRVDALLDELAVRVLAAIVVARRVQGHGRVAGAAPGSPVCHQ